MYTSLVYVFVYIISIWRDCTIDRQTIPFLCEPLLVEATSSLPYNYCKGRWIKNRIYIQVVGKWMVLSFIFCIRHNCADFLRIFFLLPLWTRVFPKFLFLAKVVPLVLHPYWIASTFLKLDSFSPVGILFLLYPTRE